MTDVKRGDDTDTEETDTQERRPCEDRQRLELCSHKPRNSKSHRKLEEPTKDLF